MHSDHMFEPHYNQDGIPLNAVISMASIKVDALTS